jgi:hypothetical protein
MSFYSNFALCLTAYPAPHVVDDCVEIGVFLYKFLCSVVCLVIVIGNCSPIYLKIVLYQRQALDLSNQQIH